MLRLSDALTGWKPGESGAGRSPLALLEAAWPEIVGADVAAHSQPAAINGKTLLVTTRSSAWSHQLTFLAEHVVRAVAARLPGSGVEDLRFRVGRIARRTTAAPAPMRTRSAPVEARPPSGSASEALERFQRSVSDRRRSRRDAGWSECAGCGGPVRDAGSRCAACLAATAKERAETAARLLFEAPWLGYSGTSALVSGLQEAEYEEIRTELLRRWWRMLAQARAAKRLSRDGRERAVASSYVLLQSKIPPEEIMPATVRSILGDELHDLLYGES